MLRVDLSSNQSFPWLSENGSFHRFFGWNSVLRIMFFSSKMTVNWLFLRNILWNILYLICNTCQAVDNNKVLPEENREWFENISKTAHILSFYEQNQTTIFISFYPKSLWNKSFADSLGNLWFQLEGGCWFFFIFK